MSIIDDPVDDDTAGQSIAAPPDGVARPPDKPPIKLRSKKHGRAENGRLRPTSIHIFEDLEKNGVIPDKALSSYKVHRAQLAFLHLPHSVTGFHSALSPPININF